MKAPILFFLAIISVILVSGCTAPEAPAAPSAPSGDYLDDFGCFPTDCDLPPGMKELCQAFGAGSISWPADCMDFRDVPCQQLCKADKAVQAERPIDWADRYRNDKSYVVRGKPAQEVIAEFFAKPITKTQYDVPFIKASMPLWFCNSVAEGEEYLISEVKKELTSMKEDLNIEYADLRFGFTEDWAPGSNGFTDNTYSFGENACGPYTSAQDIMTDRNRFGMDAEAARALVRAARDVGLKVMLHFGTMDAPDAPPKTGDKVNIRADDLEEYANNYVELITPYLRVAEEENVELVVIGAEDETGPSQTDELNRVFSEIIIPAVRAEYSGLITYAENVPFVDDITFWGELDYIGVDFYEGLTYKTDPTVEELYAGVKRAFEEEVMPYQQKYDRPVLIIEHAFNSFDGDNMFCDGDYRCQDKWLDDVTPADHQEQADEFQASLDYIEDTPWMYGSVVFNPGYVVFGPGLE